MSCIGADEIQCLGRPIRVRLLERFQELDQIPLLICCESQHVRGVVAVDDVEESVEPLPSWKYGGCCHNARSGVVRYIPVALRDSA